MKLALFLIFVILAASCSSEPTSYIKSNSIQNEIVNSIPAPWELIKSEGSDFALRNIKTQSIFLFNSSCRKYEASSLNALTSSILTGIDEINIIDKKNITLQNREAQEIRATGKVDGVSTYLNIITLQKNYCIYDFVIISTNEKKLNLDYDTFQTFTNRIKIN